MYLQVAQSNFTKPRIYLGLPYNLNCSCFLIKVFLIHLAERYIVKNNNISTSKAYGSSYVNQWMHKNNHIYASIYYYYYFISSFFIIFFLRLVYSFIVIITIIIATIFFDVSLFFDIWYVLQSSCMIFQFSLFHFVMFFCLSI